MLRKRWILWVGCGVGAVILVLVVLVGVAYAAPGNRIVRSVYVAGVHIGGMTVLDATHVLEKKWETFSATAFTFVAPQRSVTLLMIGSTSDENQIILDTAHFSPIGAANSAYAFGRHGSWWQQTRERLSGFLGRRHDASGVGVDNAALKSSLQGSFGDLDTPAVNAGIAYDASGTTATVTAAKPGTILSYDAAVRTAAEKSKQLSGGTIQLTTSVQSPPIEQSAKLDRLLTSELQGVISGAPYTLVWGEKKWEISEKTMKKLVGFTGSTKSPHVGFDEVATTAWLNDVAKDINVKPQNAKFLIVDGKAKEFQPSVIGTTLDIVKTLAAMQYDIIESGQKESSAIVTNEQPLTDTTSTNDMGIAELVAEASTNFKNSPTNRKFNLSYGASLLNGLLIQPGEEFSLVKALGKIDQAHGWKPELVIKGAEITPEFGGGLCQVATTLFRTALNAGLPITERHNHSLRISYYEPPVGLDATIYEPKPDLRFLNDYSTPLLIQTKVDGTNLIFSFYGTKDSRTADIPTPTVYNKVGIPATKYVEVDTLKPGEEKCQKPGHPGADAKVTYTVTYADGHQNVQTFTSHYRAMGVICQVGKKAAPKTTNTNTATSPPTTNTTADITITNQ